MSNSLDILLLPVLILVFTVLGRRVFKLTRIGFSSFIEEMVFSFGLGAGIIALLTLGVGFLGGLRRWVFYLLTFGLLGVLILDVKAILIDGIRWVRAKREWLGKFESMLVIILVLHFFFTFVCALVPRTHWDSLAHHLLVPKIYIQSGRILSMFSPGGQFIEQSNYPSNMEMLLMFGMLLKSDVLATLISWSVSVFLALSVYSLGRQFLSPRASLIAMAIVYCSPIVTTYAAYTFVDLGVALFLVLAISAILKWRHTGSNRLLVVSGIYAGLCAGTKYTGLPLIPVAGAVILLVTILERREFISGMKYSIVFAVIALAVSAPWYIKSYLYVGNPVYPFLAGIFGGENIPPGYSKHAASTPWKGFDDYATWYNLLLNYIRFPWDLTMMRGPFNRLSSIGPLYLLFIPPLLFIRKIDRRVKYLLFFGLFGLSIIFALGQRPRYMFPFVPPLAVVASYSISRIVKDGGFMKRASLSILAAAMVINLILALALAVIKGPVVIGLESREDYILKMLPNHGAISFINNNLPGSARILSTDPRLYYCDRSFVYDAAAIDYRGLGGDETKLLEALRRLRVSHVMLMPGWGTLRSGPALELYKKLADQGRLRGLFAGNGLVVLEIKG